jgi:MoxR-like ATPase
MRWPLHFFPVTSRTQSNDLLYTIDQLKRLQDAQAQQLKALGEDVRPGVLWEAFDPEGARTRSATPLAPAAGFGDYPSGAFNVPVRGEGHGSVVLIDEIDKADPDVPNNLLVPLGSYVLPVPELNIEVYAHRLPLIVLTTNNERKLPPAFLRRCVHVKVPAPDYARLLAVGRTHYSSDEAQPAIEAVANLLAPPSSAPVEGTVSIAEYLDVVRACVSLKIDPNSEDWKWMRAIVVEA